MITIVSGLPRSGTSMTMQMLSAGGMEILTDEIRTADTDNPRGYYEYEPVKSMKKEPACLREEDGKAVKVVSPLLRELPLGQKYKIIFMRRNLREICSSQSAMLSRMNQQNTDGNLRKAYKKHLKETRAWIEKQNLMEVLYLDHRKVLKNPRWAAEQIEVFLDADLDVERMAQAVDPSLYRNRLPSSRFSLFQRE